MFIPPPSGKSANLIFFGPKIFVIHMCIKFGEYISFCSRVIIFFVKIALDFRTFWGPIAKLSRNFNFFSIIIDIRAKNLGLVRKSRFRISLKFAKKRGPVDPKSQGGGFDFP